jgi:hypothetical protein
MVTGMATKRKTARKRKSKTTVTFMTMLGPKKALPREAFTATYTSVCQLGDRVRHRVHGFTGIVDCIMIWINGCARIQVAPETMKDGQPLTAYTFDDHDLEVLDRGVITAVEGYRSNADGTEWTKVGDSKTGGPRPDPVPRRDPR